MQRFFSDLGKSLRHGKCFISASVNSGSFVIFTRKLFKCIHITSGIHTAVVCSKITYGAATPPNLAVIEANPVPIERTDVGYSSAT